MALPNIEGKTLKEAEQSIRGRPLWLAVKTAESAPEKKGIVVDQDPESVTAESWIEAAVTVGSGPAPVAVPNLVGLTPEEAQRYLEGADLLMGDRTEASPVRARGSHIIVDQWPAPGTPMEPGSAANITTGSSGAETEAPPPDANAEHTPDAIDSASGQADARAPEVRPSFDRVAEESANHH